MNNILYTQENLGNIKSIFEKKTGVTLGKENAKKFGKPAAAAAAAAVLCVALIGPALGANIDATYNIIYDLSPSTAQFFKAVNAVDEDNGIRMEVISASVDNNTANIYISMQDLTGDRIDETTDLFDSYSINTPFDCAATCQNISYENATKTATFLINITKLGDGKIIGNKITFSVKNFLSGKKNFDGAIDGVSLKDADTEASVISVDNIRGSSNYNSLTFDALAQKDMPAPLAEGVKLTAMGYIDGKLHIQLLFDDIIKTDNHGYVYLLQPCGEGLQCSSSVSFWADNEADSYEEYVFDVAADEAEEYTLYGCFSTGAVLTEGNWQVTFPID